MDWDYGLFGKVRRVRIRMVVGLERCPKCGLGLWLVLSRINKDWFVEHVTMFPSQSTGMIWVGSVA
jgi:hypothetical protein